MQSCACRPRQTLAERINSIIAKYETKCECQEGTRRPAAPSVPKIFSSPCIRGSPCPVFSPSPGPGLCRYISRRNLCPALKGCLSLYKRPSGPYPRAAPPQPSPSCCRSSPGRSSVIGCPGSRPSCVVVKSNPRPPSSTSGNTCPRCSPCPCSESRRRSRPPCACDSGTVRPRSTTRCCCSSTPSTERSSSSAPGTCCTRTERRRLTAFDDPPYASHTLEREFSSRFIRLDPCYCETDSSSSLENSSFGDKYR